MDVTSTWKRSSGIDELIRVIVRMKSALRVACDEKWGAARFIECDVYASHKNIELFRTSEAWSSAAESSVDPKLSPRLYIKTASTKKADFKMFVLHEDDILDDVNVRIIAVLGIGDGLQKVWYGNVAVEP